MYLNDLKEIRVVKKFVFDKVIYIMAGKQRTELQHATYKSNVSDFSYNM